VAAPRRGGFTGRANSALPLGDPGLPPMTVLPQGAGPDPLLAYLAERSWVPRPALGAGRPGGRALCQRCGFRDSHRYQDMIAP
jgi:hypothetical protein